MKAILLIGSWFVFAVGLHGAPPLEIQSAVEVKIGTSNNRIYQIEAASPGANVWRPVGPAKWGRGMTVTNVVPISVGSQLIFQSREYDLTNGLAFYFPLDGPPDPDSAVKLYAFIHYPSRFGTPNHAAGHVPSFYSDFPITSAGIYGFAQGTNDFSISIWGSTGVPGAWRDSEHVFGRIFSAYSLTNTFQLALIATDSGAIELYFGGAADPILVTRPIVWIPKRWYCFQLVRKANVFRIYRDTELAGEVYSEIPNKQVSFNPFTMGPEFGSIDEVRLYNRALSNDELGVLFRLEEH
jgi:hypothetical protein